MKLTDIEFVKVDPISNIKRIMSLKSAARRIREHNRIHYAAEPNSLIITEILESCARLLEDIDAGKVKYVEYGEWKWVDDDPNNTGLICTACGEIQDCGHFKFCPNCGAEMKKEDRIMGLDMYIEVDGSEVIYMRKANAIRKWFADNLDNFIDNGTTDIPREKFKALIDTMYDTIEASGIHRIYDRYVHNDCEWVNERHDLYDECKEFVKNGGEKYKTFCEIANKMFPTSDGFFFGSRDYDDWYINQLISNYCKFKQLYMDLTNDDKNDWRKGSVRYYEWY